MMEEDSKNSSPEQSISLQGQTISHRVNLMRNPFNRVRGGFASYTLQR